MRPIKFRGRDVHTGKYRYGDITQTAIGILMDDGYEVASDSIAQLVGYDKNGNEVYEGDTVIEEYLDGEVREHVARLESMTQVPETAQFYFFPFPAPFTTLKEPSP